MGQRELVPICSEPVSRPHAGADTVFGSHIATATTAELDRFVARAASTVGQESRWPESEMDGQMLLGLADGPLRYADIV